MFKKFIKNLFASREEKLIKKAIEENATSLVLNGLGLRRYQIPESLGQLTNLVELQLGGNRLFTIPAEVFALEKLEILNIGRNSLDEIPPEIGMLKNLTHLDVTGCKLTELPPEIENLSKLKYLQAGENYLIEIPWIGKLTELEELHLGDNEIEEIPGSIGNLSKLKLCDFDLNHITSLPEEMSRLKNLAYLWGDNPQKVLSSPWKKKKHRAFFKLVPEDYPQLKNTGLAGTKLEFFMKDFQTYLQKMSDNEDICISHLTILSPHPEVDSYFEKIEQSGTLIDPEIKSFYKQCNGIRFRWFWTNDSEMKHEHKLSFTFSPECFHIGMANGEYSSVNYIAIEEVQNLFTEDAYMREYLSVFKEQENVDLWIFNYCRFFSGQLCFGISLETKELNLYYGDDHLAGIYKEKQGFADYMQDMISIDSVNTPKNHTPKF